MEWKFYTPGEWESLTTNWVDMWLWPVDTVIEGNMGNKINLTVDSLHNLLNINNPQEYKDVIDFATRLERENKPYWIGPYLDFDWEDGVSMIINCTEFSKAELIENATIYLQSRGFIVNTLTEATNEEAFTDVRKEQE